MGRSSTFTSGNISEAHNQLSPPRKMDLFKVTKLRRKTNFRNGVWCGMVVVVVVVVKQSQVKNCLTQPTKLSSCNFHEGDYDFYFSSPHTTIRLRLACTSRVKCWIDMNPLKVENKEQQSHHHPPFANSSLRSGCK